MQNTAKNKVITIAGNIIVDSIKMIDAYPEKGYLANISAISRSIGGCVPNTAINLAKLGARVKAVGNVGGDEAGRFAIGQMSENSVDISGIKTVAGAVTSFTDVMTVKSTGERTFFTSQGANALFCQSDIQNSTLDCNIFHLGYLLLLDVLDASDNEFGTCAARLLHDVRRRGIKTSIDVISGDATKLRRTVLPALRHCDYVIINEAEGGCIAGIPPRMPDGKLNMRNIRQILECLRTAGAENVFIHCPEAGFALTVNGFAAVPSLELPDGYIVGAVGAGDAFCAGVLYAVLNGMSDTEALELGSCAAALNLSAPDSVSKAASFSDTIKLKNMFPRKKLNEVNLC